MRCLRNLTVCTKPGQLTDTDELHCSCIIPKLRRHASMSKTPHECAMMRNTCYCVFSRSQHKLTVSFRQLPIVSIPPLLDLARPPQDMPICCCGLDAWTAVASATTPPARSYRRSSKHNRQRCRPSSAIPRNMVDRRSLAHARWSHRNRAA